MTIPATRCPLCETPASLKPRQYRGFLERWTLGLFGMRPYRCATCGGRILRRRPPVDGAIDASVGLEASAADPPTTSVPDREQFTELIEEIERAERRKVTAQMLDDYVSDNAEDEERKRKKEHGAKEDGAEDQRTLDFDRVHKYEGTDR